MVCFEGMDRCGTIAILVSPLHVLRRRLIPFVFSSLGYNYLVFDITGDFVFGMLKATKDIVPAARSRDDTSGQGSP